MAVAALGASLKMPGTIEDPEKFGEAMAIELAEYPADILTEAIRHARRTLDWFPSIKEMIAICDQLIGPRREQRRVVTWMIHEHQRRQDEADRAKREVEAEARRQAEHKAELGRRREWLQNLECKAREHFGDDGPLPGDVELAESLSTVVGQPIGQESILAGGACRGRTLGSQVLSADRARRAGETGSRTRSRFLERCSCAGQDGPRRTKRPRGAGLRILKATQLRTRVISPRKAFGVPSGKSTARAALMPRVFRRMPPRPRPRASSI